MKNKKNNLKKQGNVFIPVGFAVLIIIFAAIFLVYYQINIIVESVRQDLYYATKNAILSFDTQELSFKKYKGDSYIAKQIIEGVLNKNYTEAKGSVNKIEITSLQIIHGQNAVIVNVQVRVVFRSVINIVGKNEHEFKMNEYTTPKVNSIIIQM